MSASPDVRELGYWPVLGSPSSLFFELGGHQVGWSLSWVVPSSAVGELGGRPVSWVASNLHGQSAARVVGAVPQPVLSALAYGCVDKSRKYSWLFEELLHFSYNFKNY